jgi:hypothetical protein
MYAIFIFYFGVTDKSLKEITDERVKVGVEKERLQP